jgi:hypothetical protein
MSEPPETGPRPPDPRRRWQVWAFGCLAVLWALLAVVSAHQRAIAVALAVVAALLAVNAARGPRRPK